MGWEGAASRMIRKSEDLPEWPHNTYADRSVRCDLEDKTGESRIDLFGPGFRFSGP